MVSSKSNSEPLLLRTIIEENLAAKTVLQPVPQPEDKPVRLSLLSFALSSTTVVIAAVLAWPHLPRLYESTATIVLSPTNVEGQSDVEAARQPLDESFLLSDLDRFRSVPLAQAIIDKHALGEDDEFRPKPALLKRVASFAAQLGEDVLPESWGSELAAGDVLGRLLGASLLPVPERSEQALLRENLWQQMVIDRNRQSYTVKVGFRSKDPAKAAALTTTLVDGYLKAQVNRKIANANALNKLLSDRVKEAERRAESSRREMKNFLEASGLIDEGAQVSLEAQLATLSTELANARANLIDVRTRAKTLSVMKEMGRLDSAPEVLASPVIQQLNRSLTESMSRLAVMSTESRTISRQAEIERERILQSVGIEADNWASRERLIAAALDQIRAELVDRRRDSLRLEALRLEADNDARALADAMTRLKTVGPSADAARPDAEVLSPAIVPADAAFPNLPLYSLATVGAAILAGLLMNVSSIFRLALRDVGRS